MTNPSDSNQVGQLALSEKRTAPKKLNLKRIRNIALFYIERYGGNQEAVRGVLLRRIERNRRFHDLDTNEAKSWVEQIITELVETGYINDEDFAQSRIRRFVKAGHSRYMIKMKLLAKGLDERLITKAIKQLDEKHDIKSAWIYARKRRLGPFRGEDRLSKKQRDLAAFARRGFPLDIALMILDCDSIPE